MCGWAGLWCSQGGSLPQLAEQAAQMAARLTHRGPDDAGTWADAGAGIALGFRRLSIVDLSPEGHQPMVSASGRFVIAFNGEVYNFKALGKELEARGHRFRGHSDTEVMLAAFEEWGLNASVRRFVGMFAFGLWDRERRQFHLVRDRLGIKPLYYARMGDVFLCGSELKALRGHPGFEAGIDRSSLTAYVRYNYVPAPRTIYENVFQLPPGCTLTLSAGPEALPAPAPFWSARDVAEEGLREPFAGSEMEAVEHLDGLLRDAVGLRMVADVPLGAFLSGGIDSSTVVALMQAQSTQPVKTFSIGFQEPEFDEAGYARAVARHLGTEHTELVVTPAEARSVIPLLPNVYDEPLADSSQIPTYLVSKLARQHVTVSLSGDGGDELFAGYSTYALARRVWSRARYMPMGLRHALSWGMLAVGPKVYDTVQGWVRKRNSRELGPNPGVGDKIHKLADVLKARTPQALFVRLISHWREPAALVIGGAEPLTAYSDPDLWLPKVDFTSHMTYLDTVSYLPHDILTKLDRASMAVSLEARVPLLDHRVVEFAWRLPRSLKVKKGVGKWILRRVLDRYVPGELINRPKKGFAVPIGRWLRGPLRDWAESLLGENRLRAEGYFDPRLVQSRWEEHLSGQRNWEGCLWSLAMFQAWRERWCA